MTRRIAILVDGDNTSHAQAARIMHAAAAMGRVDLARVYGNAAQPSGWLAAPGFRMIHSGCGKNAADVLLCIEAMELALTGDWAGVVIASSDGDFVHLAQRLRDRGLEVLGIGTDKAPARFRAACSTFVVLTESVAPLPPAPKLQQPTELDRQIRAVIGNGSEKGQGILLSALNGPMVRDYRVHIASLPERNWRAYLSARPDLYALEPKGPDARVRYRAAGFGGDVSAVRAPALVAVG